MKLNGGARALAQDLLDVVRILPPGDELVRQIENSIFVQEAQRPLRLNMGRSAKGLRMLEELLQRRLNKAGAAAEAAQEGQAAPKRGRGRPPSHDITKVNEAIEAFKAGKPWTAEAAAAKPRKLTVVFAFPQANPTSAV
ncbi:MAG: hypothetical protein K6T61_14855 [Bryobacteraceae bacterium]|nr:hypothetical protein [Bryobacteraceae bacterium]